MNILLLIVQCVLAISLMGLILIQSSKGGMSGSVSTEVYRSKRGAEKLIFRATILCAVLFLITSIANLMVR